MVVWEVLQRRKDGDWEVTGGVKAPDHEVALHLARETHFRRGEGDTFAVRRRGTDEIFETASPEGIGGVIQRDFRRMDSFAGVGGKHRKIAEAMAAQGRAIDRPRPPDLRQRRSTEETTHA